VCLLAALALWPPQALPAREKAWWPAEVGRALARAGANRAELVKALRGAPPGQRAGIAFLVANMPERDLSSLSAAFLLDNLRLAYRARDPWRRQMYELCLPLVKHCKTPGEAAQVLNRTLFARLKVRYGTDRKQAHQSPRESIAQGKASCTGLSILLADACRSVAVPARLAGTPAWTNGRGNHTWVEVWGRGWHFAGAAEPDLRCRLAAAEDELRRRRP
jgi:transglutaminase-like putative cysteine protease